MFGENVAQTFNVVVIKLAVSRGRTLRNNQALAFEETDFRNSDIGKLLKKKSEYLTNGKVGTFSRSPLGHDASTGPKKIKRKRPTKISSPC